MMKQLFKAGQGDQFFRVGLETTKRRALNRVNESCTVWVQFYNIRTALDSLVALLLL
jgi:hypothetical protein